MLLAEFSVEDYRFVRKTIKDIVLMTDMFHHSKLVQSLDSLIAAGPGVTGVPLLNSFNAAGRAIVLQMIVHAADISNTCRPPELCGKWAKRVTDGMHLYLVQFTPPRLKCRLNFVRAGPCSSLSWLPCRILHSRGQREKARSARNTDS